MVFRADTPNGAEKFVEPERLVLSAQAEGLGTG
jgi:hypothetical protein